MSAPRGSSSGRSEAEQLAALREAGAAIAYLLPLAEESEGLADRVRAARHEVDVRLGALAVGAPCEGDPKGPPPGALAQGLLACLDAFPPDALRRLAPGVSLPGSEALIDLLIEDDEPSSARIEAVEILVARLSTGFRAGGFQVVRDPAARSPRLRALGERLALSCGDAVEPLERRLLEEAAAAPPRAALSPELEALRSAAGLARLHPRILRATAFLEASRPPVSFVALPALEPEPPPEPPPSRPPDAGPPVRRSSAAGPAKARPRPAPGLPSRRPAPVAAGAGVRKESPPPDAPGAAGEPRWHIKEMPVRPPPRARRVGPGVVRRAAASALFVLGTLAAVWAWTGPGSAVRTLDRLELVELAPWLQNSYMGSRSNDRLMFGTVGPEWKGLAPEERVRSTDRMARELRDSGVEEVLLFDEQHRLVAHRASGVPPFVVR